MEQRGRICPRGASYYVWQEGDTLQDVARRNNTTAQAIEIINEGVNFNALGAGSEICLPSQVYTCISGQPYTVRVGDTLTSIADAFGVSTYELMERNPGVTANDLLAGMTLCVPERGGSSGGGNNNNNNNNNSQGGGQIPVIPLPPIVIQPTYPSPGGYVCRSGYTPGIVQRGQTYADLLITNNVSYQAMRAANPSLAPSQMVAGRPFCAPPAGTRQVCSTVYRTYRMLPGETLASLAARLGTTQGRLLMLNPSLLPSDFAEDAVVCVP